MLRSLSVLACCLFAAAAAPDSTSQVAILAREAKAISRSSTPGWSATSSMRWLRPPGFTARASAYNLCPAPAAPGKPCIPWADGCCPFSRALLVGAGFTVLAFDRDDSQAARAMGRALGWDSGE